MEKGHKLYAAYGFFINQKEMADRCPTALLAGASEIKDHRLVYRGENAEALATVEEHKGGSVPILLWEITPADEAALDNFHCLFYRKEQIKVKLDGRTVNATVYIMDADDQPLAQPSAYYYTTIFNGYTDAGFDEKIIRQSLSDSIEPEEFAAGGTL
ncbi:MAG: gamma-glutamylcyclotransferase [Firmicutes bacterium]|nr:gamma-glutamylcyclotransferase [Bacillota bacterium]